MFREYGFEAGLDRLAASADQGGVRMRVRRRVRRRRARRVRSAPLVGVPACAQTTGIREVSASDRSRDSAPDPRCATRR